MMKKLLLALLLAFAQLANAATSATAASDPFAGCKAGQACTGTTITATTAFIAGSNTDVYLTRYAAKQLMISGDGVGATTNAGAIIGYNGASTRAALWSSVTAPTASNSILSWESETYAYLGGTSASILAPGGQSKLTQYSTAGAGPAITAGTAASAVNALSITQTWNYNAAAITGILANFTDTSSHASTLLMDLQVGGVSQFSIGKGGAVTVTGGSGFGVQSRDVYAATNLGVRIGTTSGVDMRSDAGNLQFGSALNVSWTNGNANGGSLDTNFSRIAAGIVGVGTGASGNTSGILKAAAFSTSAPTTNTAATYTVLTTDSYIINNRAGTVTVTLPSASTYSGRQITTSTITANTVVSASSNVVPQAGGAAGTAILAATAGKWARMVSDGTNWVIMESN